MNILLLQPNANDASPNICVPLGLLYVATALMRAGENRVRIIDARLNRLTHEQIAKSIDGFSPGLVGISGFSVDAQEIHALAGFSKQLNPDCPVVIGGPYATASYSSILQDRNIDFVVIGEGENTAVRLAHSLEGGGDSAQISGLAFRKNGAVVVNPSDKTIEDIDIFSFPAWELLEIEKYFRPYRKHAHNPIPASHRLMPVFTSRGCPFSCIYCHNIFGKKLRLRSVENVIEEIELLIKAYNIGEIEIVDDVFNCDLTRAKQICDEIVKRRIKVKLSFPNGLRIDMMDEELIEKLKNAGTHFIYYAIESASPSVQKMIKKNLDLAKARKIVEETVRQGIVTAGYFMLGFPGETKEEMLKTIKFAKSAPFHLAEFFFVTPRPNTQLFAELEKMNIDLTKHERGTYHNIGVNASAVSDAELMRLWVQAHREFYFRPSQIIRLAKAVPNKIMLLQCAFFVLIRSLRKSGSLYRP